MNIHENMTFLIYHLIHYLSKLFPNEFMFSIASVNSSSIQHDRGSIYSITHNKAGHALWCVYTEIDNMLWHILKFLVRSRIIIIITIHVICIAPFRVPKDTKQSGTNKTKNR